MEIIDADSVENLSHLPQNPTAAQVGDLIMLTGGTGSDNNSTKAPTYDWDDANTSYDPYTGSVTAPVLNQLAYGGYITSWSELYEFYTINSMPQGTSIGIAFDINQEGNTNLQLRDLRVYGIQVDDNPDDDQTTIDGLTLGQLDAIFGGTSFTSPFQNDLSGTLQGQYVTLDAMGILDSSTSPYVHELAATDTSVLSNPISLAYGAPGNTGTDALVNTNLSWFGLYGSTFDQNDIFLVWVQTSAHNDGADRVFLASQYLVPEPSALTLLALAGLAVGLRRRPRQS